MVLLDILQRLLPQCGARLSAFHAHHGLSPNADAWQDFCAGLCRAQAIPFSTTAVVVCNDGGEGIEAAARRVRHAAFAGLDADWVGLAHHSGDQAETLLFNLIRGTGLRGAGAMQEARAGRPGLLRPLLGASRSDIHAYAVARNLRWIEDESNAELRFSRNYLRHKVMPALAERFPGAEANLAAAARRFGEALDLLDALARIDLGARSPAFPLPVEALSSLPEPRARNLLRFLLAGRGVRIPSEERLAEALRQLVTAGDDRHPAVHFGPHTVYRAGGQVLVRDS